MWELLGHARRVEPSPDFTNRVMRAVRHLEDRPAWWQGVRAFVNAWLARPRLGWAMAAAAGVVLGAGLWWGVEESGRSAPGFTTAPEVPPAPAQLESSPDEWGEQILTELAMLDEATALLAPSSAQELREDDLAILLF